MTTADKYEFPQGEPLFNTTWRAVSEANAGVGVLSTGDFQVSTTANALELNIAAGDLWYPADSQDYSYGGGTVTLSSGDGSNDRWDLVYFDTSTTSVGVREGTAETNPTVPDLQADEFFLAYVYVASGASDVSDSEVHNWRSMAQKAGETRLDDSADDYSGTNVEDALTEVIREAGDPLNGDLDLSGFSGGSPLNLGTNPTTFGAIVDLVVDSNSAAGTEHSYIFAVDGGTVLKVYAESDGSGGVQNLRVELPQGARLSSDLTDDRGNTLYDYQNDAFRQGSLGGPASDLNAYPLELGNDTDGDLLGSDLSDSNGPGTLYDSAAGEFVRGVLDDARKATVVTSSTYTTSGEEVLFIDTATIAASSTITIASADVESGRELVITDLTGSAGDYPITVETEGTETIDGGTSKTIATGYAGATFSSDGSNWVVPSPPPLDVRKQVEGAESGAVADAEQGTLIFDHLESGETLNIQKAIFTLSDGTAVPTGLDLIIATLDNSGGYTGQTTIYAGDGSTIWDGNPSNSIGEPLASFTASSATTVAVLANNQTGNSQNILSKVTGERSV